MPQNYDYSVCNYIKRKKYSKKIGFFAIFVTLLSIVLIIFIADFISGKISGNGSILFGGKIKVASFSIYAIELGEYNDINSAHELSNQIKRQGGAGYIYQSGTYHVFVSMYENVKDAEQVVKKLGDSGTSAKIYTINIPSVKFEYKGEQEEVVDAISLYKDLYRKIYQLSIDLDSNNSSEVKIESQLDECIEDIGKNIDNIENLYERYKDKNLLNLVISLNVIKDSLYQTRQLSQEGLAFSSSLKELYFKIIIAYLDLAKSV